MSAAGDSITGVGITSLAVSMPSVVRTNEYWRKHHPKVVAEAEQAALARLWKKSSDATAFDQEMAPYVNDPFRGTVNRRVLGPGETPLTLEVRAARDALAAASLTSADIDCLMVTSFLPDQIGIGNSAFLARALEYQGAAWNMETACTSGPAALQTATAMVRAGEYRRVMVVISCTYSRVIDESDSLGWFMGDGCGAFIVSAMPGGADGERRGVLATKILNTSSTCNTFYYDIHTPADQAAKIRIQAHERTGRVLRDTAEPFFLACCDGALEKAGLSRKDVSFLVTNTPTRWYAKFCARAFGISPDRAIDTHESYANIGPALMPVNLYHAARSGRINPGDVVLVYSVGSASSAGAVVMRWGDVALGPEPRPAEITE